MKLGFRVTQREMEAIRTGIKVYATAPRVPKLTFEDWRVVATACSVGSERIKASTGGATRTPSYTRPMSRFLAATGFAELNKDDIAVAMRMLPMWDAINEWRATLSPQRREKLNNPRQVEAAYEARGGR